MEKKRPVTQLLMEAVPGRKHGLRVCWAFLLGAALVPASVWAMPASEDKPVKDAATSKFVGSETCATCHEETAKGFAENPHSKLALQHGKSGVTCEGCHGAGKEHVDGGADTIARDWAEAAGARLDGASDIAGAVRLLKDLVT